jgi:hypothetical protein
MTLLLDSFDPSVTQGLAKAGRNLEDIRTELFRELEAVRHMNSEPDGGEERSRLCLGALRVPLSTRFRLSTMAWFLWLCPWACQSNTLPTFSVTSSWEQSLNLGTCRFL